MESPYSSAVLSAALIACSAAAQAQTSSTPSQPRAGGSLDAVTVTAPSADASAEGLTKPYAGGQVSRGGRVGLFGNQDVMDTPFNTTSYTNELIQNQQSRSVGDLLLNDPSVRVARGFGNFQESYFIRGFLLSSDNVAYNGLYSLLPRQYISSELFERVELVRGASAFLNGASPSGDGIGGAVNLLPKRAPNEALTRPPAGLPPGGQPYLAADAARRFGPDNSTGVRLNVARREGGTGISRENVDLTVAAVGLDWRSSTVRVSADIGYQNHKLEQTRTNVTLSPGVQTPRPPGASSNWAQPWSYSNERDTFGTLRAEWDISDKVTAYLAYGARRNNEANSLANIQVDNATTGAGTTFRFDNTGKDHIDTGELGVRAKLRTGSVGHTLVASWSKFRSDRYNAFGFSTFNGLATNLYAPVDAPLPALTFTGNDLANPTSTRTANLTSYALGDTMSFLDDTLLVTVGVRHQRLDLRDFAYTTHLETQHYDQGRTSPLVGAVLKLNRQFSLYANYIEGLTQGDTAPATATNPGVMLAPYVSKQKEIGLKYDGGRIGAAVALFSTTKPRSFFLGPGTEFTGAGEDTHRGVELTVFGEAMRGLRVLGGLTLLDTEQSNTGLATSDGKRVIGVPRAQASLGVEWDVPMVRGLTVDGRLIATGSRFSDADNTVQVAGYGRVDLGARYLTQIGGKLVTFRARVNNVGNRNYWASVGGFAGSGYLVLGSPRTLSFTASVDL